MGFRGDLRNLIQESDLQYLNPERRRSILEESISLEIDEINEKISKIFDGGDLIEHSDNSLFPYENLLIVSNLCGSYKEFIELIFNNRVDSFLDRYIGTHILKKLVYTCGTREDFIKLCSHNMIFEVLFNKNQKNLFLILEILRSKEELFELLKNINFQYLITKGKSKNINTLFNILNINNTDQLLQLFQHPAWEHIKKLLKNGTEFDIINIIQQSNSHMIDLGNIKFNTSSIGTCSAVEELNNGILIGLYPNYVLLYFGDILLGYVKTCGMYSFLALDNIYNKEGILMFCKGMVYALDLNKYIINNIEESGCINISELNSLGINPIRMIQLDDFDILVEGFLKRNGLN